MYKVFLFLFITHLSVFCFAQEVPQVISYSPIEYAAANQNWSITEGCDRKIYIANTDGVLIFNGLKWLLVSLPNNHRPRSIFKGNDCKVYVSGYETFGYIDMSDTHAPVYQPLADSILAGRDQEYWRIFGDSSRIYFQSFSEIFLYENDKMIELEVPGNIMLGSYIADELLLPKINGGLYIINDRTIKEDKYSSSFPLDSKIIGLSRDYVATQNHGIFKRSKEGYVPLNTPLNERLKINQINSFLPSSDGHFIIGTILNGLYITKDLIEPSFHLNKSNGLSNNTILSLFEDEVGNIWCGLDKGIDVIRLNQPARYYYDQKGQLGSVFTSVVYNGDLYLGTNQGVFKQKTDGSFDLIRGSQGQLWSFLVADGDLLCGHNKGTFLIRDDKFEMISPITGGWCMKAVNEKHILQSSYTGLVALKKVSGQWSSVNRIKNGNILLENFEMVDHTILGFHSNYGILLIELNSFHDEVVHYETIRDIHFKSPIIIPVETGFIVREFGNSKLVTLDGTVREDFQEEKLLTAEAEAVMNYTDASQSLRHTEQLSNIRFNKPKQNDSAFIFGTSDGYVKISSNTQKQMSSEVSIDYFLVNGKSKSIAAEKAVSLRKGENDIVIQLRAPTSNFNNRIRYKLQGWDEQWFPIPDDGRISFNNLSSGLYRFSLTEKGELAAFEIAAPWYSSWPGGILYAGIGALIIYFFNNRQNRKLKIQKAKLEAENLKELESERIKAKNKQLENEVLYKNKMLANSTMTLVQKNQMLIDLKNTLRRELKNSDPAKRRQILHLIELNIDSDEDWELFESTFAEVHDDFLEKLRTFHPNLTQGELRLSAYIKMDLSSKEIAPLMNISVRSIENKRYRLRKKLGIIDKSLKRYIQGL